MIGGVTYDTGQLLDCSSTQGAPCVQARNKDNAGDVIITFLAVGDPTRARVICARDVGSVTGDSAATAVSRACRSADVTMTAGRAQT